MEKIIITGINGFIGGALAEFLKDKGYYIIGIGRNSKSKITAIQYYQKDLVNDDIAELLKYFRPDYFIHCAGTSDVNFSLKKPYQDLYSSVVMTERMLYQILNSNKQCRFIYMSSAAVYGQPERLPICESDKISPLSPYALHKQMTENVCLYFMKQYNMDIRILRIFSAYGVGLKKQLFWDIGEKAIQTQMIELFGTGDESRDYIYIDDLVKAIFCVMNDNSDSCERILNIASGIEIKIRQVAYLFAKEWGMPLNLVKFNGISRMGNPINWCADINKLLNLGFVPEVSIEKGIKVYVEWFKKIHNIRN